MKDGRPGRGSDQFPLRLPDGMRDKIAEAAKENGRSMNAEIVARLEETFGSNEAMWSIINRFEDFEPDFSKRIEELERKMEYVWNHPRLNSDSTD